MKYTTSDNNIIIFQNGIINIPSDDLRFDSIRENLLEENFKEVEILLNLKNHLPKGFNIKEDVIYVNDLPIDDKIIFLYKDQLEELKNHIFDFHSSVDKNNRFSYLEDSLFLDKEGEVLVKREHINLIKVFRKKNKNERALLKQLIKKDKYLLSLIDSFSPDTINFLKNKNMITEESLETIKDFYMFYFKGKESKFLKAINNSFISMTDWFSLLDAFRKSHKKIEYKTKLTNLNILLKRYRYEDPNFKNDFPITQQYYKKYYENLDNKTIDGFYFELAKHRDDIVFLGKKFHNCLSGRQNDFYNGRKLIFTFVYKEELYVTEYNISSKAFGDLECLNKNIENKRKFKEKLSKIFRGIK